MFLPYNFINILDNTNISNANKLFLTDWIITRHLEQIYSGEPTSISEEQFKEVVLKRNVWRSSIEHMDINSITQVLKIIDDKSLIDFLYTHIPDVFK